MRIITLDDTSMKDLLADMLRRDPNNYDSYTKTVEAIVENVKNRRDEAVFEYTKDFDQADLDAISKLDRYPDAYGPDESVERIKHLLKYSV